MGDFLTRNHKAYKFFVEKVKEFPYFINIKKIIKKGMWKDIKIYRLTFDNDLPPKNWTKDWGNVTQY